MKGILMRYVVRKNGNQTKLRARDRIFCRRDIPKGTLISRREKGFDVFVTKERDHALAGPAQAFFDHYGYWSDELGGYVCSADNHRFINHSSSPNVGTVGAKEGNDGDDVALRDIKAGEERTVDYRVFGENPEA